MLQRRTLRAMKARWQADLVRLEKAYGEFSSMHPDDRNPVSETQRNLATAIIEIDGMITRRRPGE